MKKNITFILVILLIIISCKKNSEEPAVDCNSDNLNEPLFLIKGKIKLQGFSYHQYGTHYIIEDSTYFALKSDLYDLDNFIDIDTVIIGKKIQGYPINLGIDPDFIEVIDFD